LFFSPPKFWVGFSEFSFRPNFRRSSFRQRARVYCRPGLEITYINPSPVPHHIMKTRKKRAARFHSQSEAHQAPTGNQEEAQEEAISPQSTSDPGHPVLQDLSNQRPTLQCIRRSGSRRIGLEEGNSNET